MSRKLVTYLVIATLGFAVGHRAATVKAEMQYQIRLLEIVVNQATR